MLHVRTEESRETTYREQDEERRDEDKVVAAGDARRSRLLRLSLTRGWW